MGVLQKQKSSIRKQKSPGTHPSNDDAPTKKVKKTSNLDLVLKETKQFIYFLLGEYSLRKENFLGVDITPHYIRLCQMDNTKKNRVLKNLASACIENNFVLDDVFSNPNVYIENLRSLVEKEGLKNKEVVLSIPVAGAIIRTIYVPQMTDEVLQRPETIKSLWHVNLAMDVDSNEYAISVQVVARGLQDEFGRGPVMEVLLVAVRQSILAIFTHIAKNAGLRPTIAVLRCFALENALENMRKISKGGTPGAGEAFLEFGADENYLFLPTHSGVNTYPIYQSSQDRVILASNQVDGATITALTQDYARQIEKIFDLHKREHPEDVFSHIYVTSSLPLHVKTPGENPVISSFVAQLSGLLTKYKVSECSFCDQVEIAEQFADTVNAEGRLSAWVVTMGLATSKLDAFGHLKRVAQLSNMNMLPEALLLKKIARIKILSRALAIIATLVLGTLSLAYYAGLYTQEKALDHAISPIVEIEQKYNVQMKQLEDLRGITDKIGILDKARLELASNQLILLSAYQYLSKTIPDGIWLKEITFESPNTISIIGNSVDDQNILEFIRTLNESNVFRKVSLKTMQAVKETTLNAQTSMAVKKFELGGEFLDNTEKKAPTDGAQK